MDIQDLRIFARVARVQNLSAVGSEFDLSAGTISKRLQALEAELSLRLFDRTTRSISITEEGGKLLGDVERILGDLDKAVEAVSKHVSEPRGRLRVSAPPSLGRGVLAPALCAFMTYYPQIELQVDLTDRIVALADSGYDVAIRTGELEDSSLVARRLAPDPQILVASPGYLQREGVPVRPEDLGNHQCLILGEGQHWRLVREGEIHDVKVTGRLRSDDGELLRHAAIEGHGILRISEARVAEDIRSEHLAPVLAEFDSGTRSAIWAVYPSSRHMLPKLRAFLQFLSVWYRNEPGVLPKVEDSVVPPPKPFAVGFVSSIAQGARRRA